MAQLSALDATRTGWSVVVTGVAQVVTDQRALARYHRVLQPWVEGERTHVIRIPADLVTGFELVTDPGLAGRRSRRSGRPALTATVIRRQARSMKETGFNLRVAFGAAGYRTAVQRMPDNADPDLAARVTVGPAGRPSGAARALAAMIPGRHTNRRPFAARRIPYVTMEELRRAAAAEGASLVEVRPELRNGVLALTRTAENRMRSNPTYLRELAAWTNASSVGRDDGLPRHVLGPRAKDAALPLRDLGVGPAFRCRWRWRRRGDPWPS